MFSKHLFNLYLKFQPFISQCILIARRYLSFLSFATNRIRKALENRTNMEDDRVSLLEQQLAQAKLIAEEADKKYEEVQKSPLVFLFIFYVKMPDSLVTKQFNFKKYIQQILLIYYL